MENDLSNHRSTSQQKDRSHRHTHKRHRGKSKSRSHSRSFSKHKRRREDHKSQSHRNFVRNSKYSDLPLEWWERGEECKEAKSKHVEKIDELCESREQLVLLTTLWKKQTVLEPNMFPYDTPHGVAHYTLWSIHDLSHNEIVDFVDRWLDRRFPRVCRWQYDDNLGDRSVLLFHVHVFVEMKPLSFTPRPGLEYIPPHKQQELRDVDEMIVNRHDEVRGVS